MFNLASSPANSEFEGESIAAVADPQLVPTVAIEALNYTFGKGELQRQILFEISLTLGRGEVVILRGPSGSGR
ncbi:MAG: hypothetical protein ACO34J_10080 [Prochlorothrix sp.]